MTPKIIHYCWFGEKQLSESELNCIESWRKYCPDYEIKEWNEHNFNVNVCAYTREAYENEMWAFVSDYARFWILYNYGGLYFDTDVELIAPINDLVEQGPFMGLEEEVDFKKISSKAKFGIIQGISLSINPGLGLSANSKLGLYKEILDYYNKEHFIDEDGNLNKKTVVERVSNLLQKKTIDIFEDKALLISGVYIYKKEYFCPLDYLTGVLRKTENTRSIHHYTASWQSEDERINTQIFASMKRKYGNIAGKALGYLFTIPVRTRLYGLKKAILLK